ncbi:MAG: hypothetical protein IJK36_02415 [Bacteroidales bacterium]|jgi:hypothetical protein|nr:hypothetical protein [Bacteroidales bacterium]MBR6226702.1 hypothetical protein [Bacteroidales bacterium]
MLNPKFDTCFFERYAMVSLATLLGEHYAHLVNRDRPDLQDEEQGIGIEVTRAIRENKNVANALVNEMAGEDVKEVNAEDLLHINQSGYAYGLGDGSIIGRNEYEYWSLALPLKRILEIKMNKVNDGFYGDFHEFGLFVFTKEDLDLDQIKQTIAFMMEKQAYQNRLYSRLFISQIQTLFDCDLETGRYRKIKISQEQRRSFYDDAIKV